MTEHVFEEGVTELLVAMDTCLEKRLVLPALLLLYSSIDIMSWLDCPNTKDKVEHRFVKWADKYMEPKTNLGCSAIDLYGARCALLHTYTSESDLSSKLKAKEIYYAWGTGSAEDLQKLIKLVGTKPVVAVQIQLLFGAFRTGVNRFKSDLVKDPKYATLVYERATKFFTYVPAL